MLKYFPPKKIKVGPVYKVACYRLTQSGKKVPVYELDEKGNRVKIEKRQDKDLEEKWIGYCKVKQKTMELTNAFVNHNFTQGFLQQVKHLSRPGGTRWIDIPLGADKSHLDFPQDLQKGPEIKYPQKEGERTCLVYGFASALHHIGLRQIATELYRSAPEIVEKFNTFHKFSTKMLSKSNI